MKQNKDAYHPLRAKELVKTAGEEKPQYYKQRLNVLNSTRSNSTFSVPKKSVTKIARGEKKSFATSPRANVAIESEKNLELNTGDRPSLVERENEVSKLTLPLKQIQQQTNQWLVGLGAGTFAMPNYGLQAYIGYNISPNLSLRLIFNAGTLRLENYFNTSNNYEVDLFRLQRREILLIGGYRLIGRLQLTSILGQNHNIFETRVVDKRDGSQYLEQASSVGMFAGIGLRQDYMLLERLFLNIDWLSIAIPFSQSNTHRNKIQSTAELDERFDSRVERFVKNWQSSLRIGFLEFSIFYEF